MRNIGGRGEAQSNWCASETSQRLEHGTVVVQNPLL